jgi:group I intron endonuclease
MITIYKITNPSGKIYIGQTKNFKRRKHQYKTLCCKTQPKIYNSLKKYGFDKHLFEVIDTIEKEKANEKEIYYILKFDSLNHGLNSTPGGNSYEKSEETKLKISNKLKGRKFSKESLEKMRGPRKQYVFKNKDSKENRNSKTRSKNMKKHAILNNFEKYFKNSNKSMILNLETGIFYESVLEASKSTRYKYVTVIKKLQNKLKNNLNFIYV